MMLVRNWKNIQEVLQAFMRNCLFYLNERVVLKCGKYSMRFGEENNGVLKSYSRINVI